MDDLWKVIGELAVTLHADRIASIADAILELKTIEEFERARHAFGPNADQERMDRLRASWEAMPNPNIPVLGDAAGVFVLTSDGARAWLLNHGDVDACKNEIVNLLEGGEEAFDQRRERYAR